MMATFQDLIGMTLDQIKAQQIEDQGAGYIPQEDDTADSRPYWYAEACPKSSECTIKSFKGARCWSYQSEEVCRLYVAKHMCMSGHHDLRAPQALEAANLAVVVEGNETWAERDQIRKCWDKQQQPASAKQQRTAGAPSKSRMVKRNIVLKTRWKGPVKREGIDWADESEAEPEQEDAGDDVEDAGEDAEEDAGEDAGDVVEDDQDELPLAMDDDYFIADASDPMDDRAALMRMAIVSAKNVKELNQIKSTVSSIVETSQEHLADGSILTTANPSASSGTLNLVNPSLNPVVTIPTKRLVATIDLMNSSAELLEKAAWAIKNNARAIAHNAQQLQLFLEDAQEQQRMG